MEMLTEQLYHSPKLGLYYHDIRTTLSEERKKRKQFYKDVREDQKAEFINGEVIVHSPVRIEHNIAVKFLLKLMDTHVQLRNIPFAG